MPEDEIFIDGRTVGLLDLQDKQKNPHEKGTQKFLKWEKGYQNGLIDRYDNVAAVWIKDPHLALFGW